MRDVHLRFSIDRSTCQRSHLSLVFCECLQIIIHKGDTGLAYEISPILSESLIGRIAEFPLDDAHDFAVMDGGIELLDIQDMRRDGFRIDIALTPRVNETWIH